MKQWLTNLMTRIDGLSLRERVFLFLSILVCALALVDAVWLSPAQTAQKQRMQKLGEQSAELTRLRQELMAAGQPVDASKQVREDIVAVNAQLEAINREIDVLVPPAVGGPALEGVLVQFLRRQEGLTLVSLSTLKTEPVGTPSPAGAARDAQPLGITRKGLELKISGPYAELVRYVKTLEAALPTLRWGSMQLHSEKLPPELVLEVFVVGVQAP